MLLARCLNLISIIFIITAPRFFPLIQKSSAENKARFAQCSNESRNRSPGLKLPLNSRKLSFRKMGPSVAARNLAL